MGGGGVLDKERGVRMLARRLGDHPAAQIHPAAGIVQKAPGATSDMVRVLKETQTEVVVNCLPVGSEMATKWYVEQVLDAGCDSKAISIDRQMS